MRQARGEVRRLHVIDSVLTPLELLHLAGRRLDRPRVKRLVSRLAAELGRPAPTTVVAARDSVELHGALLDWQAAFQREDSSSNPRRAREAGP